MSFSFRTTLTPGDIDQVHAMVSDWEVARQLGSWPWPADRAFTEQRMLEPLPEGALVVAVFDGDAYAGGGGVVEGRFGLMVPRAHWRRGVGRAIAEHLFPRHFATGADRIVSDVWEDNAASHGLHAALGFVETGRRLKRSPARDAEVVSVDYLLTRDAWEARA